MPREKPRHIAPLEGLLNLVEVAVRLGLPSAAAIAIVLGQFMLAAVLALLAAGMFLRFKRGRLPK